jgi:hypothetical protein
MCGSPLIKSGAATPHVVQGDCRKMRFAAPTVLAAADYQTVSSVYNIL